MQMLRFTSAIYRTILSWLIYVTSLAGLFKHEPSQLSFESIQPGLAATRMLWLGAKLCSCHHHVLPSTHYTWVGWGSGLLEDLFSNTRCTWVRSRGAGAHAPNATSTFQILGKEKREKLGVFLCMKWSLSEILLPLHSAILSDVVIAALSVGLLEKYYWSSLLDFLKLKHMCTTIV